MILNIILEICMIFKYLLLSKILWNEKMNFASKRNLILLIPLAAFLPFATDCNGDLSLFVMQYILVIIFSLVLQTHSWHSILRELLLDFLLLSILESGTGAVIRMVLGTWRDWRIIDICMDLFSVILILFFHLFNVFRRKKIEIAIDQFTGRQLLCVLFVLTVIAAAFRYVVYFICKNSPDQLNAVLCIGILMLAGFAACILVFVGLSIARSKLIYQNQLKLESQYNDQQAEYFKRMLEKEEETKNFRHDVNNHLYALQVLLEEQKNEEAKEYLQEIMQNFDTIFQMNYNVGNEILNILVNYYFNKITDEVKNCNLAVEGRFTKDLKMDKMDICTVFSNLLVNAYEELCRLPLEKDKTCRLDIQCGDLFAKVCILNSAGEEDFSLDTKKLDTNLHGRGIANIKRTITKNHAELNLKKEKGIFQAEVILPLK